jgi:translation elongation factor EF-Tu-like GTPase
MSQEILNIEDVFQVPERGTVVTGVRGDAWDFAKVGDPIELKSPDGHTMRNAIRFLEVFRKGVLAGPPFPGGVVLADAIASEQLPQGTRLFRIPS